VKALVHVRNVTKRLPTFSFGSDKDTKPGVRRLLHPYQQFLMLPASRPVDMLKNAGGSDETRMNVKVIVPLIYPTRCMGYSAHQHLEITPSCQQPKKTIK
jgi:hypothetical protein